MPVFPCPCCGRFDFGEPPGSYAICPICNWEDCALQLEFPMMDGGPNGRSLIEQQEIFAKVNSPRELVDPEWHKLDPATDVFLDWGSGEDSEKWREFRSGEGQRDNRYYWRKDYWLRAARKQS